MGPRPSRPRARQVRWATRATRGSPRGSGYNRAVTRRALLLSLLFLCFAGGAWFSSGPARLTLVNAGLRVDYPWPRATGAWVAFLGAAGAVALLRRLWVRLLGAALGAATLYASLHLTAFRVDAWDGGVSLRGLLGTRTLAWEAVRKIETGPGVRVLLGPGDQRISLDVTDLSPTDVAALDRTIARRLGETVR